MLLGGSSACFETGSPLVQTGFELDMYGSPRLASDSPCFHHLLTKCRDYRCAAPCLVELSLCQAFGSEALRWLVCYAFWSSRQSSSMWCIPQVSLLRSAVAGVLLVLSHLAFFSSWSPLLLSLHSIPSFLPSLFLPFLYVDKLHCLSQDFATQWWLP